MRIGHYVSVVSGLKGYERNVSGHIQVPLHAISLLHEAGHDVHLITNEFGPDRSMPACTPAGVPVHLVTDPRNRGGILDKTGPQGRGVQPGKMRLMLRQLKDLAREHDFDVMHFWGFTRTVSLGGMLKLTGLRVPMVGTLLGSVFPERKLSPGRWLRGRVDALLTTTEYVRRNLAAEGVPTRLVRHGVIRDIRAEHDGSPLEDRHRVLFWRDPSVRNGADVAMAVYEQLAPRCPDVSFDLAVRQSWKEVPGLEEAAARHENVHLHRFPYGNGITLPKLMLESLVVLMPIRHMSIDPQLVIAESLAAGVPVITTNQRSNPELVRPGRNGDLVPLGDVPATLAALDAMLADRPRLLEMGRRAEAELEEVLTWRRLVPELEEVYEGVGVAPVAGVSPHEA